MDFLNIALPNDINYIQFQSNLTKLIENLSQNKHCLNITKLLSSQKQKDIYLMLIIFQNYKKWINIQLYSDNNSENNNKESFLFKIEQLISEADIKTKNIFIVLVQWIYYLYLKLIKSLYSSSEQNLGEINIIRYLVKETNNLIVKLYKSDIINSEDVFDILYFILFLLETNHEINIHSDKLYKCKNSILLKGLFFILQETAVIIFTKSKINAYLNDSENKNDIDKIFAYMDELQNSNEINKKNNIIMIINQQLVTNFMITIIKKIDFNEIRKYEQNKTEKEISYKNKLINFYSHFIKFNFRKSKIFNQVMETLKLSFINLYDFANNKNKILQDLFVQGFYIKLLKKVFFDENSSTKNSSTPFLNSFFFNGFDSEISINVQNNKFLEKSSLFFSFNILPVNSSDEYPLFSMEKDLDKKNKNQLVFNIYLKKVINNANNKEEYDLCIYKDDSEIKLTDNKKISSNITYYFNITFNGNKIYISFYNGKNDVSQFEIERPKKLFDSNDINLIFGYNKKEIKSFSGHMGPIIIIKNPAIPKELKLNEFIILILKLQRYYPIFLFLDPNSTYSFEYFEHFKTNSLINKIKKKLEAISGFECFLYLTPENMNLFNETPGEMHFLPDAGMICPNQKNYKFNNINITLVKYEQSLMNFIMDNGLNYFCLLYEYIYQFMKNYNDEESNIFNKDKEYLFHLITTIFKKTLFILNDVLSEINANNFNKCRKQIYMNLFSCLKLISKEYYIMDDIINHFYNIIINYCSHIDDLTKKKRIYSNINNTEPNADINKEIKLNNDLMKKNVIFFGGWIDFLLTPELYNLNNTEILITLFDKISSYFNLHLGAETSIIINQHIFLKLLSFTPFLNSYFEDYDINSEQSLESENEDNENEKEKEEIETKNLQEKKEVLKSYLEALKSFFENNPSKSDNILNLKDLLKYINEISGDNYQICLNYYNFIDEFIGNNPDVYFNDDKDDEQIKILLIYATKYSQNYNSENTDIKEENKMNNKKLILNKLISIIMRIIFTKKRINKNNVNIKYYFKKLIQTVSLTPELLNAIFDEIENIINNIIGVPKNSHNKKSSIGKSEKKGKICTTDELKYISNFYSGIFDLILYFLEFQINNNNINYNKTNLDIYEEKVYELLVLISQMIKGNIVNSQTMDIDAKNDNIYSKTDNGLFTIDTIYCLIHFIKFYNTILFKRFYSEKYIQNFIYVCKLCDESCLINSNILIEVGDTSKTIIEIIFDICINYLIKSYKNFYDPLPIEKVNNVKKDNIINEQNIIFDYLKELFPKYDPKNKNKELKRNYSIFYINDYLRLISETYLNESKKASKKSINNYIEHLKEFRNYKLVNNFLMNEEKFNSNFTIFFAIKLGGYNKLLMELDINLKGTNPSMKDILKFNDLLKLVVETMHSLFNESQKLYELNESFFFKSKKANSTSYTHYIEVKKRLEHCHKKKEKEYSSVDNYIINEIFKNMNENIYNSIYSGLFKNDGKNLSSNYFMGHKRSDDISDLNKTDRKEEPFYGIRSAYSSTNLFKEIEDKVLEDKEFNTPKTNCKTNKKVTDVKPFGLDGSSPENNKILSNQDDDNYELYFEEGTPSSESNNNVHISNFVESEKNNSIKKKETIFSPIMKHFIPERTKGRQRTVISSKNLLQNFDISEKKSNIRSERSVSFYTTKSVDSMTFKIENTNTIIPYINYFDEPDECYLKNAKKELMMNIFSFYYFDTLFYSSLFKKLKNYYLQNFNDIQISTKMLDFPSKLKNYSNGLEPFIFLKPYTSFFNSKTFPISHKYFYDYMTENDIFPQPLILYKKVLPEYNLEKQYDKKCELIKEDHNYYGKITGSKDYNFIVFEETQYEFYEEKDNIINQGELNNDKLNDLFTLSLVSKKPLSKHQIKNLDKIPQNTFNKKKKIRAKKNVIILFNEIEEILERRFLLMWQAIEIFLKNGKSYFFNFLSKENCKFILDKFKENNILKDKIHEKDYFNNQKITDEWEEERLTTYEYLLFINKYSSRTFNDTNQYPIFPWLITKYPPQNMADDYRNFKFPMAAQNKENQVKATNRYSDDEDNNNNFPVHFGTHYSTSAYVYFYLMREEPFTALLIKLQSYKQENPDRTFYSLDEVLSVLKTGHDNREMIPDLFYKIEQFINLNCSDFGIKNTKRRVDDFIVYEVKSNKKRNYKELSKYVGFILDNRKVLDGKRMSKNINEWIDNIFGIGQLPSDKTRKKSLNIFYKETYEQKTDLHKKLKKFKMKYKLDKSSMNLEDIITKISNKIDLIISFGQTPYQLFNREHEKYGKKIINQEKGDFEYDLNAEVWYKNLKCYIDTEPAFFIINYDSGKIFLIDDEKQLEIIDATLFLPSSEKYQISKYGDLKLSDIKSFNKIEIKIEIKEDKEKDKDMDKDKEKDIEKEKIVSKFNIINQKYCISTFNDKIIRDSNQIYSPRESESKINKFFLSKDIGKSNNSLANQSNSDGIENKNALHYPDCNDNDYLSYYKIYINKLTKENLRLERRHSRKFSKIEEEYFRFITCRHTDNTFKIYNLPKRSSSFKKDYIPTSYFCEDFVTSCCAISYNKFLTGLKNGKLIQWSIEESEDSANKKNTKAKLNIKFNKQIQAHKKAINIIEINQKLGIIITAGYDNYIFIRKIYDLELLIPIKIKSKYVIKMAKVSPMNFLYVICFNKNNKKCCILGYTLNGLYFAKSYYDYYETLDFTKNGNVVTWIHKKEIQILYGDNLRKYIFNNNKDEANQLNHNQKKLVGASWVKFSYLLRKNEQDTYIKIITYTINEKNKGKTIYTLDVSKMKCFD